MLAINSAGKKTGKSDRTWYFSWESGQRVRYGWHIKRSGSYKLPLELEAKRNENQEFLQGVLLWVKGDVAVLPNALVRNEVLSPRHDLLGKDWVIIVL